MDNLTFEAMVCAFRTDTTGGYKITLHIPESEPLDANKVLALNCKMVQVALVPVPEE